MLMSPRRAIKSIECGQHEKNAVKAVHKSAVTGHYLSVVLEAYLALYHRRRKVTDSSDNSTYCPISKCNSMLYIAEARKNTAFVDNENAWQRRYL